MLISGTGASRTAERGAGFSLVEVLVTLLVVVLVLSLTSLQLGSGSGGRRLRAEVDHVASLIDFARIEAQSRGRDIGLELVPVPDGRGAVELHWLQREPLVRELDGANGAAPDGAARPSGLATSDRWVPAERESSPLVPFSLGAGIGAEVVLWVNDVPVEGTMRGDEGSPPVIFYAGGEATPGELRWRSPDDGALRWRLRWDLLGRSELLGADALPLGEAGAP